MKGRPVLGVICGFLFGLFLGPTLWLWGVIELASPLMWILPLAGIVLGIALAAWAPFGKADTDRDEVPMTAADQGAEREPVAEAGMPSPADGGDDTPSS
ncbi:MAG: hypothetical protein R2823_01120 [Acidimicrobiia bacterium]